MEQRAIIKFHAKLGKTPTERFKIMKSVYGHSCLSRAKLFQRYKRFREGRESLEDDSNERSVRPTTSLNDANVETIRNLLLINRRVSCRMIANEIHISKTVVHESLRTVLKKKNSSNTRTESDFARRFL